MTIDIICPLYRAEDVICNLHRSLKMQTGVFINSINYIVTNGEDSTDELVKKLDCKYQIIRKLDFSHSLTREIAAKNCTADIIVYITQDVLIKKNDWLAKLIKPIEDGNAEASFSRQLCGNNTIEKYTREYNYPDASRVVTVEDIPKLGLYTFFFSDASSAIKRDVFENLNYYDGKRLIISEDMYLAYKLIVHNYKICYAADSVIWHSHEFSFKQLYFRYRDTGKFFKENNYLYKYKANKAGGNLAKYIFKRAIQDKNIKAIVDYLPNMAVRFIGMQVGKRI